LGFSVSNENLNNDVVFVVIKKENCFYRSSDRFGRPPVSFKSSSCNLKSTLSVDDFDKDYVLVEIFNKK